MVYKSFLQGIKISMIFSDENMLFLKGTTSCKILHDIYNKKFLKEIPFYLVTAYDQGYSLFENSHVKQVCSKPLDTFEATKIFNEYFG